MDNEQEEVVYYYIINKLKELGYDQYETSNFAQEGFESIHNLVYWNNKNYYGFGLSASGYIKNTRYKNTSSMPKYLNDINKVHENEKLNSEDILYETIMLGLRKISGISKDVVKDLNIDYNFFEENNNNIKIRQDKLFVANEAILSLLDQIGD